MKREEALKIAKPILFNTDMVRAIQNGTKTTTRRVVKQNTTEILSSPCRKKHTDISDRQFIERLCLPRFNPGDILYVRETWKKFCGMLYGWENGTYIPLDDFEGYQYKSDKQCISTKGINILAINGGRVRATVAHGETYNQFDISNTGVYKYTFTPTASKITVQPALPADVGAYAKVQWVKLEIGSIATAFVPPDPATELIKCQRYYQIHSTGDIAAVDLRPVMCSTPTVTQLADGNYAYAAEL